MAVRVLRRQLRLAHTAHPHELHCRQHALLATRLAAGFPATRVAAGCVAADRPYALATVHGRRQSAERGVAAHKAGVSRRHAPQPAQVARPATAKLLRVAPLVKKRVRRGFAKDAIDLGVTRPVEPRPPTHRCVVKPEVRPLARRAHPLGGEFAPSALEAASQADVQVSLTDRALLGGGVALARHVRPEAVAGVLQRVGGNAVGVDKYSKRGSTDLHSLVAHFSSVKAAEGVTAHAEDDAVHRHCGRAIRAQADGGES
mmetsp:Transcript_39439/g.126714  ORF Transcript_39439/g.126714 Transcript_39439/m.126714 type:complete len:258 (-) Transcript_39439:39-812(-)